MSGRTGKPEIPDIKAVTALKHCFPIKHQSWVQFFCTPGTNFDQPIGVVTRMNDFV